MKYTEEEIIESLQADSGSAEREQGAAMLLEQYAGLLWSVCHRRLENTEDIKECVNSTFTDMCLHPGKYDSRKGSLKNYLCMIADRKAIDRYHENERRQQAEEAFVQESQSGAGAVRNTMAGVRAANGTPMPMATSDGYASGEERAAEKLEEALEQLDPMDSQILRMKYYDGMTYQEIAAQLGLTEASVKMRSLRSRKKLLKILIAILILALLAACAAVVLRRYQFTERGGVSQSDEPLMYEMVDGEISWRKGSVQYVVEEAAFRVVDEEWLTGVVTVCIEAYWLGDQTEGWNQEFNRATQEELAMVNNMGVHPKAGANTLVYNKSAAKGEYDTGHVESELLLSWNLDALGQEYVVIPIYRGNEWITEITLAPVAFREYEVSNDSIQLLNGTRWFVGPAVEGETFTIVSMIGAKGKDWILHRPIYSSRYYLPEERKTPITLTGEDGTVYPISYVEYNAELYSVEENVNQFELYFAGVPAGDYRMDIPALYYSRDWISEPFTLQLPEEVGVRTDCDVTRLFPDGSGFHITGITKQEAVEISITVVGEELVPEDIYYWEYVLDVERIIPGQPEFWMARLCATEEKQVMHSISPEGVLSFQVPQEVEMEEISLYFTDPEYVMQHDFVLDVTVEKSLEEPLDTDAAGTEP